MSSAESLTVEAGPIAGVVACSRCGTFVGLDGVKLIGAEHLCAACVSRQVAQLPSLEKRATGAVWSLGVTAVLNVAMTLGQMGTSGLTGQGAALAAVAVGLVAVGLLASMGVTVVLFCRWFHLAIRQANARGIGVGVTPGGAVGSWFIPFLNLVRPFEYTKRLLRQTGGRESVVAPWQGAWIAGGIATNLSSRIDSVTLAGAAMVLEVAAAYCAVLVVREVTRCLEGAGPSSPERPL